MREIGARRTPSTMAMRSAKPLSALRRRMPSSSTSGKTASIHSSSQRAPIVKVSTNAVNPSVRATALARWVSNRKSLLFAKASRERSRISRHSISALRGAVRPNRP